MLKFATTAAAVSVAALAVSWSPAQAADMSAACGGLARPGLFAHTKVTSAHLVAADAAKGMPEYCEMTAVISPVPGSKIGVVYRLPDHWNDKLLGLGGGGWAGNVRLRTAAPNLKKGYATAQTDGGHASHNPGNASWALGANGRANWVTLTDFAYRAVHEMTVVGKQVVDKYYGHRQSQAYWLGCSTGGRQGLMEAQRFPGDYNGVVAGAPVYTLRDQAAGIWRTDIFKAPGAALSHAQLKTVNNAVLAKCDMLDGVKDGVLTNPQICHFDPKVLECKAGQKPSAACLSATQVDALDKAYKTYYAKNGTVAIFPWTVGSELGWSRFTNVTGSKRRSGLAGADESLRDAFFGNPNFDLAKFRPVRDTHTLTTGRFAKMYQADNPDLRRFIAHGGKLILWQGFYDPGPSPLGVISYYSAMRTRTGDVTADKGVRLFMAPGVYHCGGGPGPNKFDMLSALNTWVMQHQAPNRVIATSANGTVSRPLCPYPEFARYKGGNADKAENFVCRK